MIAEATTPARSRKRLDNIFPICQNVVNLPEDPAYILQPIGFSQVFVATEKEFHMPTQVSVLDHLCGSRANATQLTSGMLKQPRRVLVVDDSSEGRWMISSILRCLGLEVTAAPGGAEGCEKAMSAVRAGGAFDLVLMDWQMPDMDGCEATVRLRSAGYAGRIVALLSPSSFGAVDHSWQRAGCDGFASKPISYEMLERVIRTHVQTPAQEKTVARPKRTRALAS